MVVVGCCKVGWVSSNCCSAALTTCQASLTQPLIQQPLLFFKFPSCSFKSPPPPPLLQGSGSWPAWNHEEFSVHYPSLAQETCIGGVYAKYLIDPHPDAAQHVMDMGQPKDFFHACFHRFLTADLAGSGDRAMAMADGGGMSRGGGAGAGADAGGTVGVTTGIDGQSHSHSHFASESATAADAERVLCLRCMAAVYRQWASDIGAFEGTAHMVRVADTATTRALRHAALELIEALTMPRGSRALTGAMAALGVGAHAPPPPAHAGEGDRTCDAPAWMLAQAAGAVAVTGAAAERASRASAANCAAVMDAGGVAVLVGAACMAHGMREQGGQGAAGAGVGMLADAAFVEPPRLWHVRVGARVAEEARRRLGLRAVGGGGSGEDEGGELNTAGGGAGASGSVDGGKASTSAAAPPASQPATSDSKSQQGDGLVEVGPLLREELLQLAQWGLVNYNTWVWARDMPSPSVFGDVRELRWAAAVGGGSLGAAGEAMLAMRVLTGMATMHRRGGGGGGGGGGGVMIIIMIS